MLSVAVRSETTLTKWYTLGSDWKTVGLPIVPPIVGPCNLLVEGNSLVVYDWDSEKLITQYRLKDGVFTADE